MIVNAESALEYGGFGLAVIGLVLVLASLVTETVTIGDVTVRLLLAGDGFIVAGLALLTVRSLLDGGEWWYLPLFIVMAGQFLMTLTGPTATNPLETVGFAMVLFGCAGLIYLAWQQRDSSAASG